MTRARFALLAAAVAVLAIAAAVWLSSGRSGPSDGRTAVPLDRLLLTTPGVLGESIIWTVERTWSLPDAGVPNRVRRWSANGRAPELTQTVYRHRNAAAAEHAWDDDDPAEPIATEFGADPSTAPLPRGLSASHARVSCAASDRAGCKIWVYWARYGQYDLSLDYSSVDTPVPRSRFETHVRTLDRHLTASF